MDNEVEACSERVCDHVRRSLAGIGNLLMENRRNTVEEIDPGFEAGVGTFDDHAAFHLGKGCHDVEEKFAACGGGIESFCEGTECDAALTEVVNGVDDVADGSSEPVEFPDDEDITVVVT